jgi:hypothetical protein
MEDLIEALQIFLKYKNEKWPTNCSHDLLAIMAVTRDEVSGEDTKRLEELSFIWMEGDECWGSFRFGSA